METDRFVYKNRPAHFWIGKQPATRALTSMATPHWATASASLDSMMFSTMDGDQLRNILGVSSRGRAPTERRELPQVEVRYHSLSVSFDSKVPKASTADSTLLDRASRWWRPSKSTSETSSGATSAEPESLRLSNVNGVLRPGTLTLVLGRPGSGKSALLQALAGRLDLKREIRSGEIRYNGMPQRHVREKVLPHCVAYVAQQDDHHAALTVRETFEFARHCCGSADTSPSPRSASNNHPTPFDTARGRESKLDELFDRQLGLAHCADSFVGDELRRGVSGGERKRVTIGEMLLGDDQRVLLLDEVSTGLDSATAMDVVSAQRRVAREKRLTVVMALLQPAPELVMLFDDLVLLTDGYLLYHGPVNAAIPHFCALRIVCPLDVPLAEFLLNLGTDRQAQYEVVTNGGDNYNAGAGVRPPRTPSELAAAFRRSPLHVQLMTQLKMPSVYRDGWEASGRTPKAFKQGFWRSTLTLLAREIKLVRRNRTFLVGRAFAVIVMALLYGTLFYRVNRMDAQVLVGVLFSAAIFVALGQASQLPTRVAARQIFAKQRSAYFFRTKSYVLAQATVQLPTAVLEAVVFGATVYLLCDFAPAGAPTARQAGHMARFLALLLLVQIAFSAMFSAIAAASPDIQVASTLSMLAVLVFILFGGFLLPVSELPSVLQPLYSFNPIAWAIRGLAVNQYGDDVYRVCQFDGVDYCERYGKHAGEYALSGFGLSANDPGATIVAAVGFLLGFAVLSLVVAGLALERYRHRRNAAPNRPKVTPSEVTHVVPSTVKSGMNAPSSLGSDATSSFGLRMISSSFSDPMTHTHSYNCNGNADACSEIDSSGCDADSPSGRNSDVVVDITSATPESHLEFALLEENRTKRRLTDRVADMARKAMRTNTLPRDPATLIGESVPPVTVAFRNLSYSVSSGGSTAKAAVNGDGNNQSQPSTYLLRDVSGFAQPRTLTALMGSSGAGKTTLLDVLAGRKTRGRIEGDILLNGVPFTTKDAPSSLSVLHERTGYCEQVDLLCEMATCREAIAFSARLRRGRDLRNSFQLDVLVDGCLRVLGLADIAHQQVSAMSLEQRKRTAIGVELVAGPSVLLLDEPTSGLDAPASKMVVDAMRHAATAMGCTVICTIHQPSTELFLAFDRVLLLARGGQVAFFGNVARDSGCELISHFEGIDGVVRFPGHGANPAEWMLDVIGAGIPPANRNEQDVGRRAPICQSAATETYAERSQVEVSVNFAKLFRESPAGQRLDVQLQRKGIGIPVSNDPADGGTSSQKLVSLGMERESALTQVQVLLQRFLLSYWRSRPALVARIGANLVMAIMLGAVFFDVTLETYTGVNSGAGLIFTSAGLAGIVAFNSAATAASETRALFYREHATRAYNTVWYVVAGTLAELPVVAASTLIFTLVEFPMVGLWSSSWEGIWRLVAYWLALSLNTLLQVAVAQLLVFALPTLEVAAVVGALYNSLTLSFMGYNPPARAIPSGYRWLYHSVPTRYSCALMLSIVFGASDCVEPTEGSDGYDELAIGCRRLEGALPPALANVSTVQEMVETMYLARTDEAVRDLAVALLCFLALRALALLALERVNHQRK